MNFYSLINIHEVFFDVIELKFLTFFLKCIYLLIFSPQKLNNHIFNRLNLLKPAFTTVLLLFSSVNCQNLDIAI